jgi:hypothetical protein
MLNILTLNVELFSQCVYTERRHAECRYSECRGALIF